MIVEFDYEYVEVISPNNGERRDVVKIKCYSKYLGKYYEGRTHRVNKPIEGPTKQRVKIIKGCLGDRRVHFVVDKVLQSYRAEVHLTFINMFDQVMNDHRILRKLPEGLNAYEQSINWGPDILYSQNGIITEAEMYLPATNARHTVDTTWYTRDGEWANSEVAYIAKEMTNAPS